MRKLYNLTTQFMDLLDIAEDPDVDLQVIRDTMESLEWEIENTADECAKTIKIVEGDIAAMKAERDRISKRIAASTNFVDSMKKNLEICMNATGKTKFKTLLFNFYIQKNQPKVVIDHPEDVPESCMVYPEPTINKKAVKELLSNPDTARFVTYAHMEQTESLRIR